MLIISSVFLYENQSDQLFIKKLHIFLQLININIPNNYQTYFSKVLLNRHSVHAETVLVYNINLNLKLSKFSKMYLNWSHNNNSWKSIFYFSLFKVSYRSDKRNFVWKTFNYIYLLRFSPYKTSLVTWSFTWNITKFIPK